MSSGWLQLKDDEDDVSPGSGSRRHFHTGSQLGDEQDAPTPPPAITSATSDKASKERTTSGTWTLPLNSGSGIVSDFQTIYGKGKNDGGVWVHSAARQFRKLAFHTGLRIFGTLIFVGLIILMFEQYSKFVVMDKYHKYTFNSLSVLLFLLFGIHLLLAFKELAEMARWRILAGGAHKLKDIDLILGMGSLRSTVTLGIRLLSHGTPGTKWLLKSIICFGWVGLICLLNVGIALLGLSYSVDDADQLGVRPGIVSIANLRNYFPNNDTSGLESMAASGGQLGTEQFMANIYGIASFSYKKSNASDDLPKDEYWLEQYTNGSWKYHFHDLNHYGGLNVRTDRFVTTNQTCKSWKIENITADWETFWYWKPEENIFQSKTLQELLPNFTTYALQPTTSCERCRRIDVVQLTSAAQSWTNQTEGDVGYYFYCEMEVGPVFNPKYENHILGDREAQIAAGAIASRGWVNANKWSYFHYRDSVEAGLYLNGNHTTMESLLSRFAVGVIASMDLLNPRDFIFDAHQPYQGNMLNVKWWALYGLLGGLLLVQIIFSAIAVWFANSVVVKDGSYISTARLLRPALDTLGSYGTIAEGDEISRAFRSRLVYGTKVTEDGLTHLDLNVDIYPSSKFPDGWYN